MPSLDGDEWVIDGQKIWTSLRDRTPTGSSCWPAPTPTVPKHRGISFLLCPMDTPGVEVRPIRMLTGESEFNEVFFDGARIPSATSSARCTEGGLSPCRARSRARRGSRDRTRSCSAPSTTGWSRSRSEYGRVDDPLVRDRLAWCYERVEIMRCSAAHPHAVPPGRRSRPRGVDLEALLERVPPGRRESGAGDHGRRPGSCPAGAFRRAVPHRRPRRAELHRVAGSTCGC